MILQNPEKYAQDYIAYFIKYNGFNPFDALMNTETKEQKIYCLCVNFLHDLEKAREKITDNFIKDFKAAAGFTGGPIPAGCGCSFADLDIIEGLCIGPSLD